MLVYGIPEFRLPKAIVQKEVDGLKALGVKVETNMVIGRVVSIDELMSEYGFEAVFIGSGAGLPMFMHIPGENLCGVYSANEFLTRINLMKAYKDGSDTPIMPLQGKKVAVVGGGNVAMDAARCSKRLGADVYVVYRRGMEELPARHEEVEHAIEEGIVFKTLNNPVKINGDEKGYVSSMTCVEMELGEPDASGRRRPIEKVGSEHDLPVDCVIMSLGTTPNPLIKNTTPGLEVNQQGRHRRERGRSHLSSERLRRRRRRHGRCHRHPRHGRRQARREEHRRGTEQIIFVSESAQKRTSARFLNTISHEGRTIMNLWHDIAPARVRPEDFFAVIEIEKGSKNKYEMDKETGALRLDRILYTSTHYPANYGFIPRTWADDGDPLDVLVLCSECIRPLSLVECYPIGVISMEDSGSLDEKIIAIPFQDPTYNTYQDISELPNHVASEIRHFFRVYKSLEGKETVVSDVLGREEAIKIIIKCQNAYIEKYCR